MAAIKCIGVLTSGGDAPGMNAAIRAVTRTAIYNGYSVKGIMRGYKGLVDDEIIDLQSDSVSNIIQQGGTMLKTARSQEFMTPEGRRRAYENMKRSGIDALVVIGGDGSLKGACIFAQEFDVPIVGLPGTIDNDLGGTDATIGYDTALNTIVEAVDKLRDTASSHERLFFVEVMGHTAGYLALNGAIASGAEAAIIPEMDTEVDQLGELINQGFRKSKNSAIVLVAENPATGGAMGLAERVKQEFPQYDARVTILGHIQRGGDRPHHGFAYGRSLHRGAYGGAAQCDDRYEQRPDRLCSLLACRQPRPDYRSRSGGSGAHPLYLTLFSNNTDFMKRVIGIGNALTDMLVNLKTDKVLDTFNLPKGSMSLVDAALQTEISKSVAGLPYSLSLGGSAGNTIRAMARLGCDVGFIGKVGTDKTGDFFIQALENLGIEPFIFRGKERSGRCVSLISPDGERTMVTFLGAALELSAAEVTSAIFEGYDCLYIEGYLVQDHELIAGAVRTAKACGLKVAIDLASFNVVEANLEFLRSLIQDYVDIVFANEDEAKAFTGEGEPLNALQMLSELCELAVVKVGIKGALIKRGSEVVHVGIMAAAKRVDTTGAGDLYAAGFLSGLCEGLTLRQCGTIGAIVAGKVIEVVGTTFSEEAWQHAFQLVEKVRSEKYLF